MSEKPKRLAPLPATLRELFLKSGNLCAYPGCGQLMMDAEGDFVGEVCHIEAAETKGERFNESMNNEERRSAPNLMLMCGPHHRKTNNVVKFPTERLREIKNDHERRFSHPERVILEKLKDWTTIERPKPVRNLKRLLKNLSELSQDERKETVKRVNDYIKNLSKIPISSRHFLGAVLMRMLRMRNTAAVVISRRDGNMILVSDIQEAFRMSRETVYERARDLGTYGLGGIEPMETEYGEKPAVTISFLDGWNFWFDIAEFCKKRKVPIERFTDELDFSSLDSPRKRPE